MDKIYTLGIDIGSTASKCVILADGKELVSKSLIPVGAGTSGPQRAISDVLENALSGPQVPAATPCWRSQTST